MVSSKYDKPGCNVSFFSQESLPEAYRKEILSKQCWNNMCQGNVIYRSPGNFYAKNAMDSATYIIVATIPSDKRKSYIDSRQNQESERTIGKDSCRNVVSFLFVLDHRFITPLTGKPVCEPSEWYLDVVCALPGWGCGRWVIEKLYNKAREAKKNRHQALLRRKSIPHMEKAWIRRM